MNFIKRWLPFFISLLAVYFLGYLYQYNFGFSLRINDLLTESAHYIIFIIFGFLTCHAVCLRGKIERPHAIYAFAIIFFISVIGVFNEARVYPEHGENVRDMLFHLSAGILGMIIWRLFKIERENIV